MVPAISNYKRREYLKSHPLAFEIITTLQREGKGTSTEFSIRLNRRLSTIYDTMSELEFHGLVKREKGKKDRRKTYFSVINPDEVSSLLDDDEIVQSYAESSSMLRDVPLVLMNVFKQRLLTILEKKYSITPEVVIETPIGSIKVDFFIKSSDDLKLSYFIEIKRILNYSEDHLYELSGRVLNFIKGENEIKNLIYVILLPDRTIQKYEGSIKKIIGAIDGNGKNIKTVIQNISNAELVSSWFIEKVSLEISQHLEERYVIVPRPPREN